MQAPESAGSSSAVQAALAAAREAARRAAEESQKKLTAQQEAARVQGVENANAPPASPFAPLFPPAETKGPKPVSFSSDTLALAYDIPAEQAKTLVTAFDASGDASLDAAEFDALFDRLDKPVEPFSVPAWNGPFPAHKEMMYGELGAAGDGPGKLHNMMSKKHLEDVRMEDHADEPPVKGIDYEMVENSDGEPRAKVSGFSDIPAPAAMGGKWDPAQFAPHYVFGPKEDAFPIRPDYDGNDDMNDNGATEASGTDSDKYRDGVIDEQQALNGSFTVTQKGEYTVLTYSNHYATNKGSSYHDKDYSTAQVYLKENAKGEMEPAFLATSWHYGTQLTPWQDVKKDANGSPVIAVGQGSHSLQPLGKDQEIPKDGLHIQGDGTATMNGESIGHRMSYDALQSNVKNANLVEPGTDRANARLKVLGYGWAAADPLPPEKFETDKTGEEVAARLHGDLDDVISEVREQGGDTQAGVLAVLDGAARSGAAGTQEYFDGLQRGLEGIDVDKLTPKGRGEMATLAGLFEKRGTEHSVMRADALRLMADAGFDAQVARHLTYAMQNGDDNAKNIADAQAALGDAAPNSPEAKAIQLVIDAISPQEDDDFAGDIADERN
jgi:hypothetical protein